MDFKIVTIFLLFINTLFAGYEKISLGTIDNYYIGKVSKYELSQMIKEIEYLFESSTGVNVFDYSNNGKPINLIYLPPSKLEQNIQKKIKKQNHIKKELESLKAYLNKEKKEIFSLKLNYEKKSSLYNEKVSKFNDHIEELNRRKDIKKNEFNRLKIDLKKQKENLNKDFKSLRKEQNELKNIINKNNNKIDKYNRKVKEFNFLAKDIESMSRSNKKIRGRTFGLKQTQVKTIFKNGKVIKEKSVKSRMDKIEIYGFSNKAELKAILAHEIGHLIGLPHINAKNALMNPVLQRNQLENLRLTFEDRENFKENF